MFMQLGFKWCIHLYYNLLSLYYFDSAVVSIPQLHKHLTLPATLKRSLRRGNTCYN